MKAQELVQQVEARIRRNPDWSKWEPLDAAGWWIAHQEAEQIRDLNGRELAETIQHGGFPGPYETLEQMQEYLDTWFDGEEETETARGEIVESILSSLDDFFINLRGER